MHSAILIGVPSSYSSSAFIRIARLRISEIWVSRMLQRTMDGSGVTGTGLSHIIRPWSSRRAYPTSRMPTSISRGREAS